VLAEEKRLTDVDVNAATASELQSLPGIGPALANKIVAGRPYESVDDLIKAGISKVTLGRIRSRIRVNAGAESAAPEPAANAGAKLAVDKRLVDQPRLVNLNQAKEDELHAVAGLTPALVKKIIAGRPYQSIDDLSKSGIPAAIIRKIRHQVTTNDRQVTHTVQKPIASDSPSSLVDLNQATEQQLREVSEIGDANAKKIVAGRPYRSVDDLAKAGLPATEVAKIKPRVTVAAVVAKSTTGLVWVNRQSKKYHREGSQWYGKTKSGEYMPEEEAIKAGYIAAKRS